MPPKLREYDSIFVSGLKIDVANFITETLLSNGLKHYKKPIPTSAFWQKEIADASPSLKNLYERYSKELPEVRKYLKVFSPANIIETLNKKKIFTLFFLTKEERQVLIYDLYLNQLRHVKDMEDSVHLETLDIKDFTETPNLTNRRKKIGL